MSKESKTARASMNAGQNKAEKKVISDEQYVKNLRYDVENGLYVAQEGAKALLRSYDGVLARIKVLGNFLDEAQIVPVSADVDVVDTAIRIIRVLQVANAELAEANARVDVTVDQVGSLAQFIMETFPYDYVEGAVVTDTAIQIFKDLLQANAGISELARKLAADNEAGFSDVVRELVAGPIPPEGLQINLPNTNSATVVVKTPAETLASLEGEPGLAPEAQGKDSIGD